MPQSISLKPRERTLKFLVEMRLSAGLNQTQLGELLGRDQTFVSKYEHGKIKLTLLDVFDISIACGLSTNQFCKRLMKLLKEIDKSRQ
jgi:transcriptional regulator with XRE-family HTH domain